MDKRFLLFLLLSFVIFVTTQALVAIFVPKPPPKAVEGDGAVAKIDPEAKVDGVKKAVGKEGKADEQAEQKPVRPAAPRAERHDVPQQHVAIGSADPNSDVRMLVLANNRGGTIERIELNSARYRDLSDRSGYLGPLALGDAPKSGGAVVNVVGAGTPAALAGIAVGDMITKLDGEQIATADDLLTALDKTKAEQEVKVTLERDDQPRELTVELGWQPLAVIRPELKVAGLPSLARSTHDPLSFLLTLQQVDDDTLAETDAELKGVKMFSDTWETKVGENEVTFTYPLPERDLVVKKVFRLAQVPEANLADRDFPAYNLTLDVLVEATGPGKHDVSFRLQGPTGLPTEGWWYANKKTAGLRDVVVRFFGQKAEQFSALQMSDPSFNIKWNKSPLDYIAVDAQYFSVALIPNKDKPEESWFDDMRPIRVGAVDLARKNLTDVSFRVDSHVKTVSEGDPLTRSFTVFVGPKRQELLAAYGPRNRPITDLLYYGWPITAFFAKPMQAMLHIFYGFVGNYGLAILFLTVLVKLCMFPISRKQAISAQRMQDLKPEIDRVNAKYKDDPEKRTKATLEVYRQNNYNPMSGCLTFLYAFLPLPIWIGLYSSLGTDVELRQAPLFGESIRWASNLAAPDMFWNWSGVLPSFVTQTPGQFFMGGMLFLGPYLNIFPLITVGLFIMQQKMFMPPATDEQTAMQQKMMQYMTVFMGLMFYKVAAGLCIYFIASSLWGIAERKLIPRPQSKAAMSPGVSVAATPPVSGNGSPPSKRRQRGRR